MIATTSIRRSFDNLANMSTRDGRKARGLCVPGTSEKTNFDEKGHLHPLCLETYSHIPKIVDMVANT